MLFFPTARKCPTLCVAMAGLSLCFAGGCRSAAPTAETRTLPIAPIALVATGSLSDTLSVAGEFLPLQEVELHAKVAGYIRHINVDIGDKVRAGQVLATLDIPELTAQVAGADAGVLQTQEQIARARSEVLRAQANAESLHAAAQRLKQASDTRPGLIAAQELDDAMARDRAAQAAVDAARSAVSATQQQLGVSRASRQQVSAMASYSLITAPFAGIVTWRYADTGALIQAGTSNASSLPVVKVAQISTLRLRLAVPESMASFVSVGSAAQISVQALGTTIAGTVARTTGALDPATRTEQVEIEVPNGDGRLMPGMYAQVSLPVHRTANALVVPVEAVDQTAAQPAVLIVNASNHVERRPVRLGISTANRTEITQGVSAGEKVIVANLASFQPGEEVTPKVSSMDSSSAGGR